VHQQTRWRKLVRAVIGIRLLRSSHANPQARPFEISDSRLSGFLLRVQPSGARSFYAQIGRGRRVCLGRVGQLTPDEARRRCELVLGNVAHGREPFAGLDNTAQLTLGEFIDAEFAPWMTANRPRTASRVIHRLGYCFGDWFPRPIGSFSVAHFETWKTDRLRQGRKPATVLGDLACISAALSHAVRMGHLQANPVFRVQKPRLDRNPRVRYLSDEEERRLLQSLVERDQRLIARRQSANQWRQARGRRELGELTYFGDHLTPAVLLSMNTGLRRGELLNLRWGDVDVRQRQMCIGAEIAKSGQTRHVPLNEMAHRTLAQWRHQNRGRTSDDKIFDVTTSFKTAWAQVLKRAEITAFRWHDLRHHFASRLAQADVSLNTVRELLGHGSMAMTIRYAHLGPDHRREAVERLDGLQARDRRPSAGPDRNMTNGGHNAGGNELGVPSPV
jgi:integrase